MFHFQNTIIYAFLRSSIYYIKIFLKFLDPKLVPSGKIIETFGFGNPSILQTYLGFHITHNL